MLELSEELKLPELSGLLLLYMLPFGELCFENPFLNDFSVLFVLKKLF